MSRVVAKWDPGMEEGGEAMQQKWIATEEGLTSGEQIVPNHAWSEEGVRATFNGRLQNFFLKLIQLPR